MTAMKSRKSEATALNVINKWREKGLAYTRILFVYDFIKAQFAFYLSELFIHFCLVKLS
jgi:hypothetical protein